MSRGRGGGRGGRGGGRGGRPNVSWDTGDEPDGRPSELFPHYALPVPRHLTPTETNTVKNFLLLRHQLRASALYTSLRSETDVDPLRRKHGGATSRGTKTPYGVRSRANQDPFTSMPTYGQRFVREDRALPDWSNRPVCRELWPSELLNTIDPEPDRGNGGGHLVLGDDTGDAAPRKKKRRLELSRVDALPNAEVAFGMAQAGEDEDGERNLLDRLDALGDETGEDGADLDDEEGLGDADEQDEAYDDEDAGDYDAENYFDNGDEMGDDYGDDGDGEGTF
ncbi:hypothetical protein GMORB2_4234 [Geosmithia morbida]|uniref:DNA-directed RNA polymerase III subunit n=1 Tax=Geosmithia morbida TaxID=1094350 RepID=A0A9P4Z0W8_9HYPO|nr:uncharacterized protein GMORB2_4234 [Geosmithia morbida]KAF4125394.1 hypothetical protein GMORB2_4234 [Geosmithia morbida]